MTEQKEQQQIYPTSPIDSMTEALDLCEHWLDNLNITDECREILETHLIEVAGRISHRFGAKKAFEELANLQGDEKVSNENELNGKISARTYRLMCELVHDKALGPHREIYQLDEWRAAFEEINFLRKAIFTSHQNVPITDLKATIIIDTSEEDE